MSKRQNTFGDKLVLKLKKTNQCLSALIPPSEPVAIPSLEQGVSPSSCGCHTGMDIRGRCNAQFYPTEWKTCPARFATCFWELSNTYEIFACPMMENGTVDQKHLYYCWLATMAPYNLPFDLLLFQEMKKCVDELEEEKYPSHGEDEEEDEEN